MKLEMDTIVFESRREIEDVLSALEQFLDEHPDVSESVAVKQLADKLDVMHMNW